ncbi:MAG: tRNA (adenosine(37)-N6)-threonylcarbamoyltransferase complex ATPase subunit type 1 TsaE [Patescibacteria group bacterium]
MIHKFSSAAAMQKFAAALTKKVFKQKPGHHARVVGLVGDLGAGKTTFVQGFAKALGIKRHVPSPTFLIFRSYKLATLNFKLLYHADAYRLNSSKELDVLDFKDILKDPHNIVIIEWADKVKNILPKDTIWLNFTHGQGVETRHISIRKPAE